MRFGWNGDDMMVGCDYQVAVKMCGEGRIFGEAYVTQESSVSPSPIMSNANINELTNPPKPSALKKDVTIENLAVRLDANKALNSPNDEYDIDALLEFQRLANYITVAQIFLRDNALLRRPLEKDDVKRRLLGHWGTCPGLNLVYAHVSALIKRCLDKGEDLKSIYVTGPGHGAPGLLACLYLEGTITHFYPQYSLDTAGFEKFVRGFSWPGGFPSHVNAETPGAIHEGGELGYALAVAYGSVMDHPELLTVCIVGDGESETGPTATAWHSHKYLDPATSGAVLPILHVNGFKISERTIPGTMDDLELLCLYTGYGYQVRFVEYGPPASSVEEARKIERRLNADLAVSVEWAYDEIKKIQNAARSGSPLVKPRWPMIILRTPKGMTGPRSLKGKPVEGTFRAHQVPLPNAAKDDEEFDLLKEWLESYQINDLLDMESVQKHNGWFIKDDALRVLPSKKSRRMGMIKESNDNFIPLDVPDFEQFGVTDGREASPMKLSGALLAEVVKRNPNTFRIFSPDEFESNKLHGVFEVTTRACEVDPDTAGKGGRVIEMLSEHTLQGFLQGYVLTGRHGLFPSYEAFLGIVTTMIAQFAKFRKMAVETKWRGDVASLNYIETSTLWRQEHNGFSHQNPGLIGNLLTLPRAMTRIYLPPDANCTLSVLAHCLRSKNYVNLIIGSKADSPSFLNVEEATKHCIAGVSVWKKYSTDEGLNPDIVLVGIGVEVTVEVIAAAALLQKEGVRVRVINVIDLMVLGEEGTHPHALTNTAFDALFGKDTPVVINFHGYPTHVKALLFSRNQSLARKRFEVLGYIEEGTTTTPWSMLRLNKAGRYDVAEKAIGLIAGHNPTGRTASRAQELQTWFRHQNTIQEKYAMEHGQDSEEVTRSVV